MKTRQKYICEFCYTEYDTEQEALDCERAHMKPTGIVSYDGYIDFNGAPKAYPSNILIKFPDGSVRNYRN